MIKQTNLDAINITSDAVQRKKIDLTVMSYDKDVHRCTVPIDIDIETIDKVLVLYTFDYNESVIQTIADLSDGKIEFDLPNEIRGYSGTFNIELDINFKNNRQATVARYKAEAQKSDIDSVDLSDQKIYHFEMFDEMVREIETKKTESIFAINGNVDLVVTSKNNAIDNINQSSVDVDIIAQQKKNEINETTNQFNSHANEQKVNIDNATTALESDAETANNAIANINAKNTQVNTLASNFTDNVATKQSDVTSKYNAFDTSVTQANQTIDEILALQGDVSDIKQKISNQSKVYGVKFTGSNAAGVRTHDAVGMVANVGVDDQLVQNDFDNVSFYKRPRCLVYHDPNGNVRVMAYEGEPGFSLQGAIFAPYTEKAQVFYEQAPFYWNGDLDWPQVTATPLEGFELAPMFKNPTDKVYLPSYWLGLDNGKACSLSGVHPEYNSINGSMATARTYHARAHLETMDARMSEYVLQLVEFATRDVQNVMTGAMSNRYNADDISILAEESTNRIVMANASADQYVVGQTICIGTTKNGSNIAARVAITSIDVYDASNKAITFDGPPLNIPLGAFTSSRAWRNGATDIVKASSGSPVSNSNGRYPCIWRGKVDPWAMAYSGISDVLIQRIGTGTTEDPYIYNAYKLKDPTLYNNGAIDGNWVKVDYNLSPSDGYVTQMGKDPKNPSVRMPIAVGGASTTYYAAYYYFGRYAVGAVFVGGHWAHGRYCSPVYFYLHYAPSNSSFSRLARLFVSPI